MKKKDLILKWLDHESLSETESKAFKELDAYDSFTKIAEKAKAFRAPYFDIEENLENLNIRIQNTKQNNPKSTNYRFWILRIAAVFVLGFGLYFAFFNAQNTTITTLASEKTTVDLPDQSVVLVNSMSSIVYDSKNWNSKRLIELKGEAFFKVAKGKKFEVITAAGTISVLGTQFNVEVRDHYFEVTCFEGLVGVLHNNKEIKLPAGNSFKVMHGVISKTSIKENDPDWTHNQSVFKSVPLHFVLKDLERQYNIKITTKNIDRDIVFTGNFVHSDLQTALQSITIPMRLNYLIDNNLITLYKE